MRLFDSGTAHFSPEFGAMASRWERHDDVAGLPFGVMWCRVDPLGSTALDRHPEQELITVARGVGTVRAASGEVAVEAGSSVLLDADEPHVIENLSDTEPLLVLSVYWMPEEGGRR